MVVPFASICCWLCLLSVQLSLLCVFCVVRVPSESVVWLIFDSMVSLASRAMVLSLMECMIYKLIDMVVMCLEKRSSVSDEVLIAYYTKASKDVEAEAQHRATVLKSYLETHAIMQEWLQMLIATHAVKANVANAAGKSDSEVSEEYVEEKSTPAASSTCSAAHTE
jgi:hypothetical protein